MVFFFICTLYNHGSRKSGSRTIFGGLNISPAESPKPHSNVGLFIGWGTSPLLVAGQYISWFYAVYHTVLH